MASELTSPASGANRPSQPGLGRAAGPDQPQHNAKPGKGDKGDLRIEPAAFSTPLAITAGEDGVAITAPDGVTISLTHEAARISARRLLEAADDPSDQIYQKPLG